MREAAASRGALSALIALARPHQWIKNGVVLAALVFSKRMFHPRDFFLAWIAFAVFCAISSAGYVFNDLADRDADRAHPAKRKRPLASGEVQPRDAVRFGIALVVLGVVPGLMLGQGFTTIVILYLMLQYLYSAALKRVVIVDVIAIAIGFVLRAYAGGVAIGVEVSPWLIFTTFLLALMLALARRRSELAVLGVAASAHRSALSDYSAALIDQMLSVISAATLVAYMIYTVSPEVESKLHTHNLYLTVPFVAFGLLRYLYLVQRRGEGGDPSRLLLKDRQLLASLILWVATDIAVLYVWPGA